MLRDHVTQNIALTEILHGVIQSIKHTKGTIRYSNESRHLVVPFDVTTQLIATCCCGDPVSFCLMMNSNGRHKASHVIPLSHVTSEVSKLVGTVKCSKGHGVIVQHDTGESVLFDCGSSSGLQQGMCVQFVLDEKENMATNITVLPEAGPYLGVVTRFSTNQEETNTLVSEVLGGGFQEFSFHNNKNMPTLLLGDIVTFYRSENKSRAAHVMLHTLVEQLNNGLLQCKGKIKEVVNDGYYGYINYNDGDIPFYGCEIITEGWAPNVEEEILFSTNDDGKCATRIIPISRLSPQCDWLDGIVRYDNVISYFSGNVERTVTIGTNHVTNIGDHVSFQIVSGIACNIVVCGAGSLDDMTTNRGLVATLRDGFGFIECEDRSCEVFFSFSACHSDINPHTLQLLDEVEFQLITKAGKTSASNVKLLPAGTISHEQIINSVYQDGIVLRPMKSLDKKGYYEGIIQSTNNPDQHYLYSISSLADPLVAFQGGDTVKFKMGLLAIQQRAVDVVSSRQYLNGIIESVKSKERYGFISYKDEGGVSRSVFFHMSNVEHGQEVAVGDQVKFQLSFSQRAQKYSASHVSHFQGNRNKPGWLVRRESSNLLPAVEFCITRQPHGPDSSGKGFNQ